MNKQQAMHRYMTSTTASIAKVEEAVSEAAMDYDEEKSAKHDYQ